MSGEETVGYGKPPKKHQFKKGQSGCPNGGHAQRRAKKLAQAEKEKEAAKKQDEKLNDLIRKLAREEKQIVIDGERLNMSLLEITLRNALSRGAKPDANERQVAQALKLYQHAKLLDPASKGPRPMVLVVNRIQTAEEWAKNTEGELLPRDPLHGIAGAEGWNDTMRGRRGLIPDAEE